MLLWAADARRILNGTDHSWELVEGTQRGYLAPPYNACCSAIYCRKDGATYYLFSWTQLESDSAYLRPYEFDEKVAPIQVVPVAGRWELCDETQDIC